MLRRFILIFIFGLPIFSNAQVINGIWKGKLVTAPGSCFPVYNIEMKIQVVGSHITGTAYHFKDTLNYVREYFEGEYKPDSNLISIQENGMISFNLSSECEPCVKKYLLTYHKGTTHPKVEEQLRGSWSGKATDGKTRCDPGTIVLQRFSTSIFKFDDILPTTLTNRAIDLVKEIHVDTGTIRLDFYDNGQIDGDTISVYVNNKTIVANKLLTAQPVTAEIKIDLQHQYQEVIMVGENLGSIPPNTALMIVYAGDKRYQLYLTSDTHKNAMVRFIYQKPEENPPR